MRKRNVKNSLMALIKDIGFKYNNGKLVCMKEEIKPT